MSDTQKNVSMDIEDRAFKKEPKSKRTLSDKQKEALAAGRAKAKAKRMEKLKQEAEIKANKEAKAIEKKQAKMTRKEQALSKVKHNSKKKKVEDFNNRKYSILEKLESEDDFHQLSSALDTIDEDMMTDHKKLKKYLGDMILANS
tara:strand:+ start:149 stop:583 length:435 start_codon:yes stop_codon:yes gene_type:complete